MSLQKAPNFDLHVRVFEINLTDFEMNKNLVNKSNRECLQ